MTVYWQAPDVTLHHGDARAVLAALPAGSVQMCATSPPYFGLRSYSGGDREIGTEGDLDAYIGNLVAVFREVRRVLRDDGVVFLNLGDAYASGSGGRSYGTSGKQPEDCPGDGYPSSGLCGECRAASTRRKSHKGSRHVPELTADEAVPTLDHTGLCSAALSACETPTQIEQSYRATPDQRRTEGPALAQHLAFPQSTIDESVRQPHDLHSEASIPADECLSCGRSLVGYAPVSAGTMAYNDGIEKTAQPSDRRKSGKGSSFSAYPDYTISSLKPKDLMMVPHRVAIALQNDGWYIRNALVWHKPNAMPESVRDRMTMDYEMVFLLSKRANYYFDQDAIREPHARLWDERNGGNLKVGGTRKVADDQSYKHGGGYPLPHPGGRNKRSVWSIPTQPGKFKHYASWPERLVEPMIRAGSSERGRCPVEDCGAPWVRETRREAGDTEAFARPKHLQSAKSTLSLSGNGSHEWAERGSKVRQVGWRPSCTHTDAEPVPCVILDPFCGSGRTGVVARKLGRHFIGIDLNESYLNLSRAQIGAVQPPLVSAAS